ncbi:ABC transporter permease [Falsirhodobacter sp. 20TX0035]|uniref:ABC transporter permease n=1 Tax=Falsirhodobacter sp. 20TX0035 TaxID=3022019 RepID=UPI00232C68F4|nr:ABC transporter permease [Falsirhodobacter sp. 20TX0035]MDB6453839.1 ABC transporter permease [Falsirhodobacter sp. 20TX0035]
MDIGGINLVTLLATLIVASVPILMAALGEMVVEKSGTLNLGVEGMMIMGAVTGFVVAVTTGNPVLGFLGGAAAGAAMAGLFALLTQVLLANQVASGLALTLFGLGLSSLMGQGWNGIRPPLTGDVPLGPLADIPVLGPILFSHDWMVYLSLILVVAIWWFLRATRAGLILRAVGESHEAAHALGYKVRRIRTGAILFGGAMAGMGGAYVSLVRVPQWTDGITSGAGWIALAIVVFASWKPWRVLMGAWLFGGISVLQLNLQAAGSRIPVEYLTMSPYIITILVLVLISSGRGRAMGAPADLGKTFHASH